MPPEQQSPTAQQLDPLINAKLKQYRPVDGPSNRQLRFGLWWVEHRVLLRRLLIVALALANVAVWVPSAYAWGQYAYTGFFADRKRARSLLEAMPNNHAYVAAKGAQAPQLGATAVFAAPGGGYEVGAEIRNPNALWYAQFEYSFTGEHWHNGYLLPGATTYLIGFMSGKDRPATIRPRLRDTVWRRVTPESGESVAELARSRGDVAVTGVTAAPVAGAPALTRVAFAVENRTAYNFWEVDMVLEARRAGQLTGLNRYTLANLGSGEERAVTLIWAGDLGGAQVKVTPHVDVFDEQNYREFNLGPGQVK